jgi:hypothetical protein
MIRTPWRIHFFQRHPNDDSSQAIPARNFLLACPLKVRAMFLAVVKAVAEAPPTSFAGGGKWEAMHAEMAGYYEVRVDGPKRHHYRLFCVLERDGANLGLGGLSLVILTGLDKPFRTTLAATDYKVVRDLGQEYRRRTRPSVEASSQNQPARRTRAALPPARPFGKLRTRSPGFLFKGTI